MTGLRARGGVVERLRRETRDEHDAIELTLDWERRTATVGAYAGWLRRLHAFHGWWEPRAAELVDDPAFFEPRRKLGLLAGDLERIGAEPVAADAAGLALATRAEALGSMYVLEGSTLGGKLIARRVRDVLGFEPGYHDPYGARTGAMWRVFQARLAADVEAHEEDEAVDAARRTFRHLRERLAG
ncbi:biliverdin-producing heme oxygenase [Sphingomonas lenta]|uniref:Biliverdin-producing heme oxygenase n=1 Tax=Sphingomonas lenta TaxID=1141887 RepID=A0A2A2SG11_9SPHN|nr:biliverdin-producing heme oxygenase [Sphingomonas lenta]PAX08143.1 biliverdin-producing heme oxygenase [Sphingomonas lenta]